jgi:hypothetical protein
LRAGFKFILKGAALERLDGVNLIITLEKEKKKKKV